MSTRLLGGARMSGVPVRKIRSSSEPPNKVSICAPISPICRDAVMFRNQSCSCLITSCSAPSCSAAIVFRNHHVPFLLFRTTRNVPASPSCPIFHNHHVLHFASPSSASRFPIIPVVEPAIPFVDPQTPAPAPDLFINKATGPGFYHTSTRSLRLPHRIFFVTELIRPKMPNYYLFRPGLSSSHPPQ